jgi:anti-anti-sigma factor
MLEERPWKLDVMDDGDCLIVAPSGEVDLATSGAILAAFGTGANGHQDLVCDITDITFMDSSGVRALLELLRREPDRFALAGSSATVDEVLNLCCVADQFRRVERRRTR